MAIAETKTYPWRIEQGEYSSLTFPVVDSNGDLFPIDGWTIDAKIRERPGGSVLYTWTSDLAVLDSDDNTVKLAIPGPVSSAWTFTTGWYRVKITNTGAAPADATAFRILEGVLVVDPD